MERNRARRLRTLGAVLFSLVLAVPVLSLAGSPSTGVPASPATGLSASELRSGPFVSDPSGIAPVTGTGAEVLGALAPASPVYFTVSFDPSNPSGLAYLIQQQETPGSALFHQFLTPSEYLRAYGPPAGLGSETVAYFASYGARYVPTGSPMTLGFWANASSVQSAFGTPLDVYRLPNGTLGYANPRPLSLPAPIASSVSSIAGLTSFALAEPTLLAEPGLRAMVPAVGPGPLSGDAANMSRAANWSTPGFLYEPAGPITPTTTQFLTPASLTVAYNASALYHLGDTGQGTTIAVVMASGYNPSDLATYAEETFGDPQQILDRLTPYPVEGEYGNASAPGSAFLSDGDAQEFALDLEYSATMAPGARLDAVYGPSLSLASLVSDYALLTTLSPVPNVVTNSWQATEDTWWNLGGPSWQSARALENEWQELTAMGSTILAASGDTGGYDGLTGVLSPSLPSSSPYVTAVGGTRTTVANSHGQAFPVPSEYEVNQTVALYGWSQSLSGGSWFPNTTLPGANVSSVASEEYWYSTDGSGSGPDYGSGGSGLSYWFDQPYWQHGLIVPDTGRRMLPDIAAEADYNETMYFAGAWSFFWGGTSFACPTIAGEVALLDSYLNASLGPTAGRTSYYLGNLDPLLYEVGNDPDLPTGAFTPVRSGANVWDLTEIAQNMSWPPAQNWPVAYLNASGVGAQGWNMLVGWGVPNIGTLTREANTVLQPALGLEFANGSVASSAPDNANYTFRVVLLPSGVTVARAQVELWISNASLDPTVTATSLVASGAGTFRYDASSASYVAFQLRTGDTSGGSSAFQAIWFYPAPLGTGSLSVAVVASPPSMMGGFAAFNGYGSSVEPAIGPAEPNVLTVRVTYLASAESAPEPVYNAVVVATSRTMENFSSPPRYPNPRYNLSAFGPVSLVSWSRTNLTGEAFVDTWNVPVPESYRINASYEGLNASTSYLVTPQLNVEGVGVGERGVASEYGGTPGYVGLGARTTILAPEVTGTMSYLLPVRVTDWAGRPVPNATIDLAYPVYFGPPNDAEPIESTVTRTNASGGAQFTINATITQLAEGFGGNLSVQVFNSSYPSKFVPTLVGPLPVRTNDSDAVLEFLPGASASVVLALFNGGVATDYVGTSDTAASITVTAEPPLAAQADDITSLTYALDEGSPIAVPTGYSGQRSYTYVAQLPTLTLGAHNLSVRFSDSDGFAFVASQPFWVIGNGSDPAPAVSFHSPHQGQYLGGNVSVAWTCDESPYLRSETLVASSGGFTANYNVTGASSFRLPLDGFAAAPLTLRINVENANGLNGSATTSFFVTDEPEPTAELYGPSPGEGFPVGTNVSLGIAWSGNYIQSVNLSIKDPNGSVRYSDVASQPLVTIANTSLGGYLAVLTVRSSDGATATATLGFFTYVPETVEALRVTPASASIGLDGTVYMTASATCEPVLCPNSVVFNWSSTDPGLGSLSATTGVAVLFRAGSLPGMTAITVNASLPDGARLASVVVLSVGEAASSSSATPIYENAYLWAGIVVIIALLCVFLVARQARGRPPNRPEPWSSARPMAAPPPPHPPAPWNGGQPPRPSDPWDEGPPGQ